MSFAVEGQLPLVIKPAGNARLNLVVHHELAAGSNSILENSVSSSLLRIDTLVAVRMFIVRQGIGSCICTVRLITTVSRNTKRNQPREAPFHMFLLLPKLNALDLHKQIQPPSPTSPK